MLRIRILVPYVFRPPGSGYRSVSQRSGSVSFDYQAKKVRKTLIPTVLCLLYDFLSLKNVNVSLKVISGNRRKIFFVLVSWRSVMRIAESGAGTGSGSGSISQRHRSVDPDPDQYQNVKDPQHSRRKWLRTYLNFWGIVFFATFLVLLLIIHKLLHTDILPCHMLRAKKDGIKEATLRFGRWNQMSSSNILSIHGLKKKHQFQDSNRDIQCWLCTCDNHVHSVLYY